MWTCFAWSMVHFFLFCWYSVDVENGEFIRLIGRSPQGLMRKCLSYSHMHNQTPPNSLTIKGFQMMCNDMHKIISCLSGLNILSQISSHPILDKRFKMIKFYSLLMPINLDSLSTTYLFIDIISVNYELVTSIYLQPLFITIVKYISFVPTLCVFQSTI